MQIISEIEERNIFLITKSGLSKFKKWIPSTYVSTEITNFLYLSKKTSSVNSNDPGLSFDSLEIEFIVDAQLENYRELHQWLVGIGFPKARTQFSSFRRDEAQAFPTVESVKGDVTNPGTPAGIQAMFGDATLTVMSAKNNPVMEVRFSDMYPVALSGLSFNQQETDVTYLTATATFTYKLYEMFTI